MAHTLLLDRINWDHPMQQKRIFVFQIHFSEYQFCRIKAHWGDSRLCKLSIKIEHGSMFKSQSGVNSLINLVNRVNLVNLANLVNLGNLVNLVSLGTLVNMVNRKYMVCMV